MEEAPIEIIGQHRGTASAHLAVGPWAFLRFLHVGRGGFAKVGSDDVMRPWMIHEMPAVFVIKPTPILFIAQIQAHVGPVPAVKRVDGFTKGVVDTGK